MVTLNNPKLAPFTLLCVLFIFLHGAATAASPTPQKVVKGHHPVTTVYSMVFDPTLIETRMHLYTMTITKKGSIKGTKLVNEKVLKIPPGLHVYHNDSQKAVEVIEKLILLAMPELGRPRDDRIVTDLIDQEEPIVYELNFQATGSMKVLRLWDKAGSTDIMDSIRARLATRYSRRITICPKDCFDFIRGQELALHSFVAVNFLLNRFTEHPEVRDLEVDRYVGYIEMNPVDFHIAFSPLSSGYPKEEDCASAVNAKFGTFLKGQCIYAKSYIFHGTKMMHLKAAGVHQECLSGSCEGDAHLEKEYRSVCLHPDFNETIPLFLSKETRLLGPNATSTVRDYQRYTACTREIKKNVLMHSPVKPVGDSELMYEPFYLLHQFFHVLLNMRYVNADGGMIKLKDMERFAREACMNPASKGVERAFHCMDLTYFVILLRDELSFGDDQKFHVVDKINGIQVGWTVGAALQAALPNKSK